MKKKSIILLFVISLFFVYFNIVKAYKQEQNIKTELRNKWGIDIDKEDKLKKMKTSRPQWHGEHNKFIWFEVSNSENILNYIKVNNLYLHKMSSNIKKRIIEIEDDLNIEKEDRIDFNSDYYYTKKIKHNFNLSSEKKTDILYIILIKGNNNDRYNTNIFLVEDLNVLDLDRSF